MDRNANKQPIENILYSIPENTMKAMLWIQGNVLALVIRVLLVGADDGLKRANTFSKAAVKKKKMKYLRKRSMRSWENHERFIMRLDHRGLEGVSSSIPMLSAQPIGTPSLIPSSSLTQVPSLTPTSLSPLSTFQISSDPSSEPISQPTSEPTATPSNEPASQPTSEPSTTPSETPSMTPTTNPSTTPSNSPSKIPSKVPSMSPSISSEPSSAPSLHPSLAPSNHPSEVRSTLPSLHPSTLPSSQPTLSLKPSFQVASRENTVFKQSFYRSSDNLFLSKTQKIAFSDIICSLVPLYIRDDEDLEYLTTTCTILEQTSSSRRMDFERSDRYMIESKLSLTYSIDYKSTRHDVYLYAERYREFMRLSSNQIYMMDILNAEGNFDITSVDQAGIVVKDEPKPSAAPSTNYSNSPTFSPSFGNSSVENESNDNNNHSEMVIGVTLAAVASFSIISGIVYCCQKKKFDDSSHKEPPTTESENGSKEDIVEKDSSLSHERKHIDENNNGSLFEVGAHSNMDSASSNDSFVYVSPFEHLNDLPISESVVSNPSLLSPVMSYNTDELHTVDDFDSFRDAHLEQLRSEVEKLVVDIAEMMSQALTNALMEEEDLDDDLSFFSNQLWDNCGSGTNIEVEASILCDTYEFSKRNIETELLIEEKRSFMQNIINKMVTRVRHEMIEPEPAALIIHGCAGMLGFELSGSLPFKTILITGLRKMTSIEDLRNELLVFGEIDAATVLHSRGFGLVRYKSSRSVEQVLIRYRLGEIVVHDVAVRVSIVGQAYSSSSLRSNLQLSSHRRISSYGTAFDANAIASSSMSTSSLHGSFIFQPVLSYGSGTNRSENDGSTQDTSYGIRSTHNGSAKHVRTHSEPLKVQEVHLTEI